MRSPPSALLTASTDMGGYAERATVIGSTTAPRSGTTGSSLGAGELVRQPRIVL
jgi:hypothetical protein